MYFWGKHAEEPPKPKLISGRAEHARIDTRCPSLDDYDNCVEDETMPVPFCSRCGNSHHGACEDGI